MKEIEFYRTYSYGDPEVRPEKRDFETIELAKSDAYNDVEKSKFLLFHVKMIFDGRIIEEEKYLGRIICGRDFQDFESDNISKTR